MKKYCLLIIIVFLLFACNNDKCKNVQDIVVSNLILETIDSSKNYCNLLDKAIRGDKSSIEKISLLNLYDGSGYDHGFVLIQLIEKIGEDSYIKALKKKGLSNDEKSKIKSYLDVGLEYGSKENKNKMLKDIYPNIHNYLNYNSAGS